MFLRSWILADDGACGAGRHVPFFLTMGDGGVTSFLRIRGTGVLRHFCEYRGRGYYVIFYETIL